MNQYDVKLNISYIYIYIYIYSYIYIYIYIFIYIYIYTYPGGWETALVVRHVFQKVPGVVASCAFCHWNCPPHTTHTPTHDVDVVDWTLLSPPTQTPAHAVQGNLSVVALPHPNPSVNVIICSFSRNHTTTRVVFKPLAYIYNYISVYKYKPNYFVLYSSPKRYKSNNTTFFVVGSYVSTLLHN